MSNAPGHRELILDQFSKQALPFSAAKTIADEKALKLLVEATRASHDDEILDVACGGGNVVCAFAPVVRHAFGIDVTPAMLDRASRMACRTSAGSRATWPPCPGRMSVSTSW
jgi:ubiquinone/menaquinone biosynthesis C-methylase UbiE